jgi:hypothetical protein
VSVYQLFDLSRREVGFEEKIGMGAVCHLFYVSLLPVLFPYVIQELSPPYFSEHGLWVFFFWLQIKDRSLTGKRGKDDT